LEIDECCHDDAMDVALATRGDTHKSKQCKCLQLWKQPEDDLLHAKNTKVHVAQCNNMDDICNRNPGLLQQSAAAAPQEVTMEHDEPEAASDVNVDAIPVVDALEDQVPVVGARQRVVNFTNWPITSYKQHFVIRVPNIHYVLHKKGYQTLSMLRRDSSHCKLDSKMKGLHPK
jgi:hypothetical protein